MVVTFNAIPSPPGALILLGESPVFALRVDLLPPALHCVPAYSIQALGPRVAILMQARRICRDKFHIISRRLHEAIQRCRGSQGPLQPVWPDYVTWVD